MSLFRRDRQTGAAQTPADAVRLHLRFVGQVQGVGFRWTSTMVARQLELTGWVRNDPDGAVTAEIQGTPHHVGAFVPQMLEAYRRRPIRYVITDRDEVDVVPGERDFEIRY